MNTQNKKDSCCDTKLDSCCDTKKDSCCADDTRYGDSMKQREYGNNNAIARDFDKDKFEKKHTNENIGSDLKRDADHQKK